MKRIFKNLVPYWKTLVVIILLLVVQAYCDLSLPQYTSDLIDIGIQDGGVTHILPEKIREDEFREAQIFMSDSEKDLWKSAYEKEKDGVYQLKIKDDEKLEKLDDKLLAPLVLTYQSGHMTEKQYKGIVKKSMEENPAAKQMAAQIDKMSVAEIEKMTGSSVKTFTAKNEKGDKAEYIDMRPALSKMIANGTMGESAINDARREMQETIDKVGSETLDSMGKAYARYCNEQAGIDNDKVQMDYLWSKGGQMFLMAALMFAVAMGIAYFASRAGAGVGRDMRSKVFKNVISYSNSEMDQFSTASLITRSTNDVQQIQLVTVMLLRIVLYAPIIGIGGIYKVAKTGAHMGWIIALGVLVVVGVVMLLMAVALPKFKRMQTLVDNINLVSREILTGLPVIRAFGTEDAEEKRFDKANRDLQKTQLFTSRVMTFMMPTMMFIMYCLIIGITWVAAHRIDTGDLQVGAMTAFIMYSMLIVMAFLMMAAMSIMLPRAGVAAERIDQVINTPSSIEDPKEPVKVENPVGVIEFKDVCFKYPGALDNVIEDISFTAEPGKTLAIIGSTGSGKSTLVNLIPRFYDVTCGSITFDGVDIRDMSMKQLRDAIGFVPQKGVLFSGTIASNIAFGNQDATDEEIKKAAEIAQALEFIEDKEKTFDSEISQGGSNVSGGQKQRLAIARAIAKNPKVLVFDDSFSALDMKTDKVLRQALDESISDATQIVVAQRISTIIHADNIIVLDEGKIVGRGTHEELLQNCTVYQQIAKSQLSAKELGIEEV